MAVTTLPPQIGQLYNPMQGWMPEGTEWRLSTVGVELLISRPRPSKAELDSVHGLTGPGRFAFVELPHILVMCAKLGAMPWMDSPWQAMRQREHYPQHPPGLPGDGKPGHMLVQTYLVDSTTGIVCGHGVVTWPPFFVEAIRKAVDRHRDDDQVAGAELDALYRKYPTTAGLVRDRADAVCKGGTQDATG